MADAAFHSGRRAAPDLSTASFHGHHRRLRSLHRPRDRLGPSGRSHRTCARDEGYKPKATAVVRVLQYGRRRVELGGEVECDFAPHL